MSDIPQKEKPDLYQIGLSFMALSIRN